MYHKKAMCISPMISPCSCWPTNQPVMLAAGAAAVMLVVVMVLVVGQLSRLDQLLEVGAVVLGRTNRLGAALNN